MAYEISRAELRLRCVLNLSFYFLLKMEERNISCKKRQGKMKSNF